MVTSTMITARPLAMVLSLFWTTAASTKMLP